MAEQKRKKKISSEEKVTMDSGKKMQIRIPHRIAPDEAAASQQIRLKIHGEEKTNVPKAENAPRKKSKAWRIRKQVLGVLLDFLFLTLDWVYLVGIQSVRAMKRVHRRVVRFLCPVTRPTKRFLYYHVVYPYLLLRQNARKAVENVRRAAQDWKKAVHTGFGDVLREFWKMLVAIFLVVQKVFFWVFNVAAPAAAIIALVLTFQQWRDTNYGLEVEYNGKVIGYVENETVISEGVQMAETKLLAYAESLQDGEGTEAELEFDIPTYSLAAISPNDYQLNANSICNAIVTAVGTDVENAAGLYVDGELVGVVKSPIDLKFILQQILASKVDPEEENMTAAFVQDVQIVEGIYSSALIGDSQQIQKLLTSTQSVQQTYTVKEGEAPLSIAAKLGLTLSQLQSLNPDRNLEKDPLRVGDKLIISGEKGYLTIRQVRQETYTKEVNYDVKTEKTDKLYVGTSKIVTVGKKGVTSYTDLVTYVDGLEVDRENVAVQVLSEPVTQVVQVGTKVRAPSKPVVSDKVTSGTYIWPVPGQYVISKGFGYYGGSLHKAMDIQAPAGSAIVATASGTVTSAGWDNGYGYNITIKHDDGTSSFYAHCLRLYVSAGTHVAQGQTIAAVGNTGSWSRGNHLHFSLIINGVYVNPRPYLSR